MAAAHAEGGTDEAAEQVPIWTYYVEIFEHIVAALVAGGAAALLYAYHGRKHDEEHRLAALGFAIIFIGEALTTAHHFLLKPFGVWNAIVNHALLLLGLAVLAYALLHRKLRIV